MQMISGASSVIGGAAHPVGLPPPRQPQETDWKDLGRFEKTAGSPPSPADCRLASDTFHFLFLAKLMTALHAPFVFRGTQLLQCSPSEAVQILI